MAPSRSPSLRRSTSTQPTRSSPPRYAHLAPRNIHVSQSKILKKWKPLPIVTQDRIRGVVLEVKNESKARRRKAVPKVKGGKEKGKQGLREVLGEEEWEGVVDGVVEKLLNRLPRMPFPPQHHPSTSSTQATNTASQTALSNDISLEPLLTRISLLTSTLSSTTQSTKLLKAQIRREQKALKRDRAELKGLEEGVRRSRDVAGRQDRTLHGIVRALATAAASDEERLDRYTRDDGDDGMDVLLPTSARTRQKTTRAALTNEVLEDDPELADVVRQLRSHLDSMQGNVASLRGMRKMVGFVERDLMRARVG